MLKLQVKHLLKYLQNKPDLIITDIRMGNETGIDFIKKLDKLIQNKSYYNFCIYGFGVFIKSYRVAFSKIYHKTHNKW